MVLGPSHTACWAPRVDRNPPTVSSHFYHQLSALGGFIGVLGEPLGILSHLFGALWAVSGAAWVLCCSDLLNLSQVLGESYQCAS